MRFFRPTARVGLAPVSDAPALTRLYQRAWDGCEVRLDARMVADQVPSEEEVRAWLASLAAVPGPLVQPGLGGGVGDGRQADADRGTKEPHSLLAYRPHGPGPVRPGAVQRRTHA